MVDKKKTQQIREFILENLETHPDSISRLTAERFAISRQAVHKHLTRLIREGILTPTGSATKGREYVLTASPVNTPSPQWVPYVFPSSPSYAEPALKTMPLEKTILPVRLLGNGETPSSRFQARRLLDGIETCSTVILDFSGVPTIEAPFADEIFRVFQTQYPDVKLYPLFANDTISRTIAQTLLSSPR